MPYALSIASVRYRVLRCGVQKFEHSDFFSSAREPRRLASIVGNAASASPKKGRERNERRGEMLFRFRREEQGSHGEARRTTKRSSGKSRLIISGGRDSLPRGQIGVEATRTFLRQREAYFSFLRCSLAGLAIGDARCPHT